MFKLVVPTEKAAAAARCGGRTANKERASGQERVRERERDEQKERSGVEINEPLFQPDSLLLTVH